MLTIFNNTKMKTKKLTAGLAVLMFLVIASPSQAQINGDTAVQIDFPPLLILFYYSTVDLTISAANLEAAVLSVANPVDRGTYNGTSFTENLNVDTATNFNSTVTLTLNDGWGVRSVGAVGGSVQIDMTLPSPTLTHTVVGTETITLSNISTNESVGATTGSTVTFAHQGLGTAVTGDITMDVDLSNAGVSGTYDGGTYRVTATSI
jgi:hypothetical protein